MVRLRDVLAAFERGETISLAQLAKNLDVEVAVLDTMIQFWVRKGKIREVCSSGAHCEKCGSHSECSITTTVSRRYELVKDS
jgi:hypothetical protein